MRQSLAESHPQFRATAIACTRRSMLARSKPFRSCSTLCVLRSTVDKHLSITSCSMRIRIGWRQSVRNCCCSLSMVLKPGESIAFNLLSGT